MFQTHLSVFDHFSRYHFDFAAVCKSACFKKTDQKKPFNEIHHFYFCFVLLVHSNTMWYYATQTKSEKNTYI